MLKLFKRDMYLCAAVTVFVIVCALAWGSPFVGTSPRTGRVFAEARQAEQMVLHGAILRDGAQLILRDSSGAIFHLDDFQQADDFVGKTVTVTGRLEAASRVIHIERIEPAA